MSDKEDKDISVFSTRENLQQQFNKTADALEKITKMYFDMKAKNKALLEALEFIADYGGSLTGEDAVEMKSKAKQAIQGDI